MRVWLNTTSIPSMRATAVAKFPKFAKPNKIITSMSQIDLLLTGKIAENFDDFNTDPYYIMIYDNERLTNFDRKRLPV